MAGPPGRPGAVNPPRKPGAVNARFRLRGAPGQGPGPGLRGAAAKVKRKPASEAKDAAEPPASAPRESRAPGWRSQRRPISAPARQETTPGRQGSAAGSWAPAPVAGAVANPHPDRHDGGHDGGHKRPSLTAPRPGTVRARVYEAYLYFGAMTADECAAAIGLPILTVRPRCTELRAQGLLVASGERRPNRGGRTAAVLVP